MIKKTLYFGNPAYLSAKNKQLQVQLVDDDSKNIKTIPIEDIGVLILDNYQITITQYLLQLLQDNNVGVILCNDRHMPYGLMLPLEGNTIQSERYKNQISVSVPLRKQLWQQTVYMKIKNQARVLESMGIAVDNMYRWAKEVTSGDGRNHEARAAAYYWDNVFVEYFKRERYGPAPNNLLNYGYAILRATVARSLVSSGLLPTLGIHHKNRYNAYCLADDIMEPYRPYVDKLVIDIVIKENFNIEILTSDIKKQLLIIPTIDVLIDNKRSPLMIATQRTATSLAKCYSGETRKILYPEL